MQVLLKSNFELGRDSLELQEDCSVRSLLDLLSQQCGLHLLDPKNDQVNGSDFTIVLNGKEHPFWPNGLNTLLRDGDEVQVLVMPLGGG